MVEDIEEIAVEIARLIKKETIYRVNDPDGPSVGEHFSTISEIWCPTRGLSIGAIFYDKEGFKIEIFSDDLFEMVGTVPLSDPNCFDKVVDFVKSL